MYIRSEITHCFNFYESDNFCIINKISIFKLTWAGSLSELFGSLFVRHMSVRQSVCLSVNFSVNFSYFHLLLRTTGQISTKFGTKPLVEGSQICSNEGPHPFLRVNYSKNIKIILKTFKIFFFRTTGTIFTKLGTKHAWVVLIQVCSNEGPHPSPSWYNIKIVKCDLIYMFNTVKGR